MEPAETAVQEVILVREGHERIALIDFVVCDDLDVGIRISEVIGELLGGKTVRTDSWMPSRSTRMALHLVEHRFA
ncbi:hypothetical protein [Natrinema sp. SYSU A 869]|uniref:hypothetical protein n=1 Tax=Natrinema sp. SYSU A 869 TaxID=2871694 RepID=UPI0031F31943